MKRLILVTGPQSLKRLQHGFLRQLLRFGQLIGGQFVAQHAGICRCIAVWSIVFFEPVKQRASVHTPLPDPYPRPSPVIRS